MRDIFAALELNETNAGAWSGDGGWSNDTSGPLIDSVNPTSGELLGRVRGATVADYERILVSSRRVFDQWKIVPAPKRGEAIRLVSEELRKHKSALGSLVTLEVGKIKAEGDGEVQEMIDIGDFAVGQSRMLYGQTMHSERPLHRMYEQWHPLGIIGIISAFNFPVAVWSWNAFLAAICGDVSIWKPSPKAPLCGVAVQKLVNRVLERSGFPGIFQLLIAGNELAEKLVEDRRVDLVSFTGSTAVGRKVGERVAARMGKSLLELGGNNGIIVDEYANLDLAVPSIVFGAVGTAGQRCTSTRRVFVHESRSKELEQRLLRAYSQVRIGDPLKSETLMGPLIDEASVQRYLQAVEKAQRAGGTVLCGGKAKPPGNFVEPTIIRARAEWEIVQTETFAPILYLIEYQSLDDAIAMHNSSHHGLSSAIFTDNLRHAEKFLSALGSDCGIANVNIGTSGAEIGGAFGGEKDTGGGRESGSDSWKAYMRRQTNTINWSRELPLAQGIDFKVMG
ncbi:L-piperidine-6-carboxylate dehydrogenase [Peristeroidobacter soli]|uniref:L-piperidine-6-carboxylate dehydrogenase n=1 Tax=Peristeroidobacter soli TaxID=2497877 RepID=UPI00101DCC21|nr:aldehyde dehydrogenase family protein [Peristeroidobacter soli]